MKKNYSAWHISDDSFSESWSDIQKLRFFAKYALLAPSGHNTQPWFFACHGDSIHLELNENRLLAYSGSLAAEPHVSLGSCLEVLCLAALGFGYKLSVKYLLETKLIATIKLANKVKPEPKLLSAIKLRVSNRSWFEDRPLPKRLLGQLALSDFSNASSVVLTDKAAIHYLASKTKTATEVIMSEPQFRAELSGWVRNNHTRQHDGMPGFVQGMPTPPSMLAKHIVKHIDISKGQAKKDAGRVLHSAAIILISAHQASPEAFFNVGRLYARACVIAQQAGVATSGVGAAVIDPSIKAQIQQHFKLPHQPTALLRLGYTNKTARHTPRWPASQMISQAD